MLGYSEAVFTGDVDIGDVVLYMRHTPVPKSCPHFELNFGTVQSHRSTTDLGFESVFDSAVDVLAVILHGCEPQQLSRLLVSIDGDDVQSISDPAQAATSEDEHFLLALFFLRHVIAKREALGLMGMTGAEGFFYLRARVYLHAGGGEEEVGADRTIKLKMARGRTA